MFTTPAVRFEALAPWPIAAPRDTLDVTALFLAAGEKLAAHSLKDGLYRVESGCLALCRQIDGTRRQILDVLGPDRLIGVAVAGPVGCPLTAFAPTHLVPVNVAAGRRDAMAAEHRQMLLDRALGHVTRLGKLNAGERVAEALLDLAGQYGCRDTAAGARFPLYLSRGDLADWLGLTLETVSRCMSRLKQEGVVHFGKEPEMTILAPDALRDIARGYRKLTSLYAPRQVA